MSGQQGREVGIVDAVRTPIGRGHKEKGYYKDTHPADLLGKTYTELVSRTGIDAGEVEIVLAGCVQQFGEQAFNIARNAWLQEGLPLETSATTLDLQCGSAQQAVGLASALVASGIHDVVIGSGVEHMGHIPFSAGMETQQTYGAAFTPKLMEKYNIVGQGLGAEMIADQWEITRHELDELAVRSHRNAARATDEGLFEREVVPFQVNGDTYVADQGIRPDTSLEALSQLKPAFKPDGKITAGNSSQISDGAAAVLMMTREKAEELGLKPRGGVRGPETAAGADRRPDDRRVRPGEDARGPDPGDREAAGAQLDLDRRHRSLRGQRGVRARRDRLVARVQSRHGPRQRARRGDGAGPSARLHRRAADHDPAAHAGGRGQGDRPRDDVLRRRAGDRHDHPARLSQGHGHSHGLVDESIKRSRAGVG